MLKINKLEDYSKNYTETSAKINLFSNYCYFFCNIFFGIIVYWYCGKLVRSVELNVPIYHNTNLPKSLTPILYDFLNALSNLFYLQRF